MEANEKQNALEVLIRMLNSSGFTALPGGIVATMGHSTALATTVTGGVLRVQYFRRLVRYLVLLNDQPD
jgi:hypothetical protein